MASLDPGFQPDCEAEIKVTSIGLNENLCLYSAKSSEMTSVFTDITQPLKGAVPPS